MEREFQVEQVALHLVDRKKPEPQLAKGEIDLTAFEPPEYKPIRAFFSGHLNKVWNAQEGRRTFAASFKSAAMSHHYKTISEETSSFFDHSCQIAKRLHDASRKVPASPGLLMVLWLRVSGDERKFLGLFKMDPGETERITVPQDEAGNILLNLAVERIKRVLPDPRDRVLKWAIIPHPTRPNFDVKAKDQQGRSDPAQYFVDFLDCEPVASEKKQFGDLLKALTAYAQDRHADEDWEPAVHSLIDELAQGPDVVTPTVLVEGIERTRAFEDFKERSFVDKLGDFKVGDLCVSPSKLQAIRLEYQLENDIIIKGPRSVMENLVQIVPVDGEFEFRIRTPGYERSYV